jgi:hypothetical protein
MNLRSSSALSPAQPPWMGTHSGMSHPYPRQTAGTAPKDSRAYGCRVSFHLIAACDSTAPHFRFGNRLLSVKEIRSPLDEKPAEDQEQDMGVLERETESSLVQAARRRRIPVERGAVGSCDLSVLHVAGEWQWLVGKMGATWRKGLRVALSMPAAKRKPWRSSSADQRWDSDRHFLANATRCAAGTRIEASMKLGTKPHILAKTIFPGTWGAT